MKRLLPVVTLLAAAAILFVSGPAHAQTGINLAWGDCGSFGTIDKTFACTSNSGSNSVYGSFFTPDTLYEWFSIEGVLDVISQTSTLPDWWKYRSGQCHSGGANANGDFSSNTNCINQWQTVPTGGPTFTYPFPGTQQTVGSIADSLRWERIKVVLAVPTASRTQIDPNTHYYGFKLNFLNTKTVGTGACAGCATPVCLVLNQIRLVQPLGAVRGNVDVTDAQAGGSSICTWQGGPGGPTCALVPTRRATWGQIKGLYR